MQFKITFQGKRESKEWSHFAWLVTINGVDFEYRTGLGHATPRPRFCNGKYTNSSKPKDMACVTLENEWVHVPPINSVLECLFSDVQGGTESFDDFCDNFGYSNDSLKALDTYRYCMESAKKLRRALGSEFDKERVRIESINQ